MLPYVLLNIRTICCSMGAGGPLCWWGSCRRPQAWPAERQSCKTCWKNPVTRQRSWAKRWHLWKKRSSGLWWHPFLLAKGENVKEGCNLIAQIVTCPGSKNSTGLVWVITPITPSVCVSECVWIDLCWDMPISRHKSSKNLERGFLVGALKHFLLSYILGIVIPLDFHIFQRGSYTTVSRIPQTPGGLEKRGWWDATATGQTGHAMQICSASKWGYRKLGYAPQMVICMGSHDKLTKLNPNWPDKIFFSIFFCTGFSDKPFFPFLALASSGSEALGLPDWLPEGRHLATIALALPRAVHAIFPSGECNGVDKIW